ncbi:HsdR family type I site-specific deoxyribonuclease [Myxococcota bacterium]|nr:HsdR family type I site-specific deoxyribonuclease [Myxococcota bacterium]MBU1379445.1 HsdR family type I site-specific deoxyribonuclease [Myxococcota bacterium]MBU1496148.1 HsdR family type I site-specific deoxyribonuclease [Myxococcota bacterium]
MAEFSTTEKLTSQIPALRLLISLGWEFITPAAALVERNSRVSEVILENILQNKLREINRIRYRKGEYLFSEENIQTAVQKLKNIKYDGLNKTSETVYDLLTLGCALEQNIEGDNKSFTFNYIDWQNIQKNAFHVTVEYSIERTKSRETARPDIVLFINGIPSGVIECKAPSEDVEQAVSQQIRNQGDDYIPRLFIYSQILLGINKNSGKYAATGTVSKFWSIWKEIDENSPEYRILEELINSPLSQGIDDKISLVFDVKKDTFTNHRSATYQDRLLYSICRPERFIEITRKFTVFDGGLRKIARYQQYFVVKSALERVKLYSNNIRNGGIIWHTQGSGKSLTMVMLVRNLALDPQIRNPRIIAVTDRTDLDRQLGNTFASCGLDIRRASSGRNLIDLVSEMKAGIITTLVHKFDKAFTVKKFKDESPDIFVLVDESHRTQFGSFSARMRQMFPNACYIGFTGTPLMKEEKNNFLRFGELIQPYYSIRQAVLDGAVVPLLYEGRHVQMAKDEDELDKWFERHTSRLTDEQKADLKRKYSRTEMLKKSIPFIYECAFDIAENFRKCWQNTPFKGQLVAPNKASAIKYQDFLTEFEITSEVIISPPDLREGYDEPEDESKDDVVRFWNKMMKRHGNEETYLNSIISQFKDGEHPEILIVVDKLLTGFDAPRNTVLYITRTLREHTLLQAVARVNRICEGKENGFIMDYASILGELDRALSMYGALEGFDEQDLEGSFTSISSEVSNLPQRYSELWDIFKSIRNSNDEEAYERLLADDDVREEFYNRLMAYGKCLHTAMNSEKFLERTDEKQVQKYKNDLKRFSTLRTSVKMRYAEAIDYRDYEPKIRKLLDKHLRAEKIEMLNEPVNIFDERTFKSVMEQQGVYRKSDASKADTIAHATKKVIIERMDEDPAFYQDFSEMIQRAIDDFRAKRMSDLEYLKTVMEIRNRLVSGVREGVPDVIAHNPEALAYFGVVRKVLNKTSDSDAISVDAATSLQKILEKNRKVNLWEDEDALNSVKNEIDDYLFDELKGRHGIALSIKEMDEIIAQILRVARSRSQ